MGVVQGGELSAISVDRLGISVTSSEQLNAERSMNEWGPLARLNGLGLFGPSVSVGLIWAIWSDAPGFALAAAPAMPESGNRVSHREFSSR